jgi:hypothetical protein
LSRPVRITPLAEADIAKAQVRHTLIRIGQNPFQYQVVSGTREHRRAPVRSFPFGVWYRVEPDESVVVACLAHRQDASVARRRALERPEPL